MKGAIEPDRYKAQPLGLDERAKGVRAAREEQGTQEDTQSRNTTLQWCAGGTSGKESAC